MNAAANTDLDRLDVAVAPWQHNPSAWRQRIPICALAMLAFFIAGYMALYQWGLVDQMWDPIFGEQSAKVLTSDVSHRMWQLVGIPDAALGALAYLGDAIFGLAGSTRRWQYRPWMVILFGIDVIPLGIVSVVLVVLQGTVVGSWCFLCLATALISLILVAWAYDEVFSSVRYLYRVWQESGHRFRDVWNAAWGRPSPAAHRAAASMVRPLGTRRFVPIAPPRGHRQAEKLGGM